jgi:hypothetical protein
MMNLLVWVLSLQDQVASKRFDGSWSLCTDLVLNHCPKWPS